MRRMKMEESARPAKRAKLLTDDTDSESDSSVASTSPAGHAMNGGFKVNEEYARRFEHNKKREEKQRLEEKYGASKLDGQPDDESDEDSTDESEDDDAELATADLDQEILATLQAIKRKDPSVYDSNVKFYKEFDADATGSADKKSEKPMYLRDYHRENILAGGANPDDEEEAVAVPQTYQQEQDALKRDLVGAMHAAEDESEDEDFLVAKSRPKHETIVAAKSKKITEADVEAADKDPETFLSNFMAARAWLPSEGSKFQPFESDDSEDEARAEKYEEAYNLRYENPSEANETLRSFARDVSKYSVRREEKKGRKKARDREREKKEAEKLERDEERARLRKLKLEEAEDKVKRIKHAAGISGQELDLDQWRDIIDGEFDDDRWEDEMKRRFGDDYYAQQEEADAESDDDETKRAKRKLKKPKWDDDIAIDDLVPDFDDNDKADFALSSDDEAQREAENAEDDNAESRKKSKTKKDRLREQTEAKRAARKERRKIEEMVDAALPLSHPTLSTASSSKRPTVGFRYRETSPTSFGLTARDILFADDSQLNQFAGLKKMTAFRDEEKKRRDRKKFSKKARLRQWRKDTFGKEHEPTGGFEEILGSGPKESAVLKDKEGGKKRKRSKKSKSTQEA